MIPFTSHTIENPASRPGVSRRATAGLRASLLLAALLGLLPYSPSLLAQEADTQLGQSAVQVSEMGSVRRWRVLLPSPLLDLLPIPDGEGGHRLALLTADDGEETGHLLVFDPRDGGRLNPVPLSLPGRWLDLVSAVTEVGAPPCPFLLGNEGLQELPLSPGREPSRILFSSGRTLSLPRQGLSAGDGFQALLLARVRSVTLYRSAAEGGLSALGTYDLPTRAHREAHNLLLRSPQVTHLSRPGGLSPLLAVGPEAHGKRRLRTLLIDPAAPPESEPIEAWSLLPEAEEVASSWYAWVDGRPILLVSTLSAEKIGVFERQRLRVFPLKPDRTRKGTSPSLARLTASRRWQALDPVLADVDGNGKRDLVLLQPEGLGGRKLIFEVHRSLGLGRFQQSSRKTVLPVPADRWTFGDDIDGDGLPDLAAVDGEELAVFSGSGGGRSRHAVHRKPRWTVPLAESQGRVREVSISAGGEEGAEVSPSEGPALLRTVDLDGDGRVEVLVARGASVGSARLEIYRFR